MNIQDKKWAHTRNFLIGSFTLLLIISAVAFLISASYINRRSSETINEVGNLYMTGINEQISAHFITLMELKLEQAETVVKVVSADTKDREELYEELTYRVSVRDFNYLALCSEDGYMEMIYGEQIQLADPEPFYTSLRLKENKVAVGKDKFGNKVILFGISANYPMKNGEKCMAMIVALPIEYINTKLDTNKKNSLVYSHIIRKDGSFITSIMDTEYKDYFSSLYERYGNNDKKKIDKYVQELSAAMEKKIDYSTILELGGSRQQIYCTSLPYSEWHLVTILPFGSLDEIVERLNYNSMRTMLLIFTIIIIALLFIFYNYFKMTHQQIIDLDAARQEALQATKAKSEFLSNMSHDIRTPMNAIVGMTAIAISHISDKEQVQNCLKKISLSGKHLLGLINDVLDMSKIESGKMTLTKERVSLREILDGIVSIVQTQIKEKGQNFNVHLENIIAEDVYCDSVRLNQVLLNLLSNAVKYTQDGGAIRLFLYQESSPKGDSFIRTNIIVKDNGIGMTEEFLEHLFDSYSRADNKRVQKTEGAGLGMAITKYIIEAMKGTITVESEIDRGTEFHVILDLEKATTQETDMILPSWKMLVVDDDEVSCQTAIDVLKSIGIQADWTQSGEKAIDMFIKHQQKNDSYQIVLLDWKLPDINGIVVAKKIHKIMDADTTIILISAYDWSEFESEAKEAGITGFISKPLFKSTLFYGLKKYMDIDDTYNETNVDMDLSGRRILVAEDNELNWEVLKELLSDINMKLEWAENGKICLEKFQKSEAGYYDAILMDVRMPVMNGYEATSAIRALNHKDASNIPIIAMTADAFSEDIQRCLESGMNAHTAKPVNLDEVILLLKKYIL